MDKVDRKKLYGYKSTEIVNGADKPCSLATLAPDGKTIIPSGGVALANFNEDGEWLDKSEMKAVNLEGEEITPIPSSFSAPIELKTTATVDEYLAHNIRGVYQMDAEEGIDEKLIKELSNGTIYQFPYSYRGGLEADAAFLLMGDDDTVWMAVGSPTKIEFISYEQVSEPEPDDEEDDDSMDFGMM